jgi:hypothetical protein
MLRRFRTTPRFFSRGLFFPFLAGLAGAAILVPTGGADTREARAEAGKVPDLVFPLVAKTLLWDNYGDPRPNGRHAGIDMENPWRAPVVAVEAGRVEYAASGLGGCMLYLYGRSGTMYLYIHLNNDIGPKNDNTGGCVEGNTYAVRDGARVLAGQQIAFNGDSGDANGNPHLHFEVHPGGGTDVNPFPHLKQAAKHLFAARQGTTFSLGLRGRVLTSGDQGLRLSTSEVRAYPGGQWLEIDERALDLVNAPDAGEGGPTRKVSQRGSKRVMVFTARAQVTKEALMGAPGALTISRVTPLSP